MSRWISCESCVLQLLNALLQVFRSDDSGWSLEPIQGAVRSLRAVAEQADQELAAAGRKEEKLADCVDLMRKLYTPLDSIHGAAPSQTAGDRRGFCMLPVGFVHDPSRMLRATAMTLSTQAQFLSPANVLHLPCIAA